MRFGVRHRPRRRPREIATLGGILEAAEIFGNESFRARGEMLGDDADRARGWIVHDFGVPFDVLPRLC